jgi:hypothetical protein
MRKNKLVVLEALADDSRGELKSMVDELCGASVVLGDETEFTTWSRRFAASGKRSLVQTESKAAHWGRRFSASGKTRPAAPIRLS